MKTSFTFILIATSIAANAQLGDIMLKKAGNALNKNKSTTDTTAASKSEPQTESTSSQQQHGGFNFGVVSKSELKSEYKFNHNALVEIQHYKKSGEKDGDQVNHRMYFAEEKYYGGEFIDTKSKKPAKSISIMEFEKNLLIMLREEDTKKTGFALKQDYSKMNDASKTDSTSYKITKTGKTKPIMGYQCEEWLIVNEKTGDKSEVWITSTVNLNILETYRMLSSANRGAGGKKYDTSNYPKGFMMESTHYETNGEKTTWKIIELNLNKETVFKTSDYEFSGY